MRASLRNVNWLPIRIVAEEWAPELQRAPEIVLQELRFAKYKLDHGIHLTVPLERPPPESELPPESATIDRRFLEYFCHKQGWRRPSFWLGKSTEMGKPGRPTTRPANLEELRRRAASGKLEENLAAQALSISAWHEREHPEHDPPAPGTVENHIRDEFKRLKEGH